MKNTFVRILALALIWVLALSVFVSCGGSNETEAESETEETVEDTAYSLLAAATEKLEKQSSYEMKSTMTMNIVMDGTTMEIPMEIHIVADSLDTDKPRMLMEMGMTMMEQDMDITVYDESTGIYYIVYAMAGTEMKMQTSDKEIADSMGNSDAYDFVSVIPENVLENTEIKTEENGLRSISVALDSETFNELFDGVVGEVSGSAAGDTEVSSMTISNANVTYRFDAAGNIVSGEMSFDIQLVMEYMGMEMAATVGATASFEYTNPGATVTVTPPEGYLEFPNSDTLQ